MAIGLTTMTQMLTDEFSGFIDNTKMQLKDLDLDYIATNAGGKQTKLNPDRMLVRHNWMEIFFRLAMSRYVRIFKEAQTPSEAVQMLID